MGDLVNYGYKFLKYNSYGFMKSSMLNKKVTIRINYIDIETFESFDKRNKKKNRMQKKEKKKPYVGGGMARAVEEAKS